MEIKCELINYLRERNLSSIFIDQVASEIKRQRRDVGSLESSCHVSSGHPSMQTVTALPCPFTLPSLSIRLFESQPTIQRNFLQYEITFLKSAWLINYQTTNIKKDDAIGLNQHRGNFKIFDYLLNYCRGQT